MRKQIIFVADDFGMNPEINEAILHAHRSGNLHAAALMMGQAGTTDAVAKARENPQLQIGWHLHLNDSRPVTLPSWPWGSSPARAGVIISLSQNAQAIMRGEIARQWELFQKTGLPCQFVNCHHHLHAHPAVHQALVEIVGADFKGWIRLGRVRSFDPAGSFFSTSRLVDICFKRLRKLSTWRSADTLWGLNRLFAMDANEVRKIIATLPEGFHEFLFHPRTLSCPDTQCLLELRSLPTD
jgi:predicted glycoside hydrolase/deacetylase ChbG (UPF0249 family)